MTSVNDQQNTLIMHKLTPDAGAGDITAPAAELKQIPWVSIIGDFGAAATNAATTVISTFSDLDLDPPGAGGSNPAISQNRIFIIGTDPVEEYFSDTNIITLTSEATHYPIEETVNAFTSWNSQFPTYYNLNYAWWNIPYYNSFTGYTNWTSSDITLDWVAGTANT